MQRRLALAWIGAVLLAVVGSAALAHHKPPPLRRYVGSPDYPALLKDPIVQPKLQAVVGKQLPTLLRNISISGGVDLVAGTLAVNGGAFNCGGAATCSIVVTCALKATGTAVWVLGAGIGSTRQTTEGGRRPAGCG